jgi:hypothetical protein
VDAELSGRYANVLPGGDERHRHTRQAGCALLEEPCGRGRGQAPDVDAGYACAVRQLPGGAGKPEAEGDDSQAGENADHPEPVPEARTCGGATASANCRRGRGHGHSMVAAV